MVYDVRSSLLALACALGIACQDPAEPLAAPPTTEPASETFVGAVREVLPAGHYTYVRLRVGKGDERWVVLAGAPDRLARHLTVRSFGRRHDFASRRLGRTFAELHFATLIENPEETTP